MSFLQIVRQLSPEPCHRLNGILDRARFNIHDLANIESLFIDRIKYRLIHRADDLVKMKNNMLINGNEIKRLLKTESGHIIDDNRGRIFELQFKGKLKTRADASEWIISNLT